MPLPSKVYWFVIAGLSVTLYQILGSVLVDDFDKMNDKIWRYEQYRFEGNGCNMISRMVSAKDGRMAIQLEKADSEDKLKYNSGGIATLDYFTNSRISIRLKADLASGVVGSILLSNKWTPNNWEQKVINIEFFGKAPNGVLLSVKKIKMGVDKPITKQYYHTFKDSAISQFHTYEIDWQDSLVQFSIDDHTVFESHKIYFDEPMNVEVFLWAADKAENPDLYNLIGPVDDAQLPSAIFCDWVKVVRKPSFDRIVTPFKL
jgi:beta-glucanase (GH16 family)